MSQTALEEVIIELSGEVLKAGYEGYTTRIPKEAPIGCVQLISVGREDVLATIPFYRNAQDFYQKALEQVKLLNQAPRPITYRRYL